LEEESWKEETAWDRAEASFSEWEEEVEVEEEEKMRKRFNRSCKWDGGAMRKALSRFASRASNIWSLNGEEDRIESSVLVVMVVVVEVAGVGVREGRARARSRDMRL